MSTARPPEPPKMKPAFAMLGAMSTALARPMFCCSQVMSGSRMKFANVVSAERTRSCCSDCADAMPGVPANKRSKPDICTNFNIDLVFISVSYPFPGTRRELVWGCTLDRSRFWKFHFSGSGNALRPFPNARLQRPDRMFSPLRSAYHNEGAGFEASVALRGRDDRRHGACATARTRAERATHIGDRRQAHPGKLRPRPRNELAATQSR